MLGQLAKQALLLLPAQRVRLPLVAVRQQLDLGRRQQPSQTLLVHPLARRQVQDAPNDLQSVIDGPDGDARCAADRAIQGCSVPMCSVSSGTSPIHGISPLQPADVVVEAALVLVLQHKLRRRLLERASRPHTVHLGLPCLFHHSREFPFRFFELSCASALANSPPEDALVDVPDPASDDEAGYSFASHVVTPFARAGRPLRATYSSTQASSSRRSKPMPCLPIGISVRRGAPRR